MEEKVLELITKYPTLLEKYEINTPLRKSHFFAQIAHESGLKPISENLNYSADRLLVVFPKYFNKAQSVAYARQPQRIANKVYASRMGNGNEASGDGWKYRGKGLLQLTGKANYQALSNDTGINYVGSPEKLLNEPDALISSLWFWQKNNLNKLADADDVVGVTKKINGGETGLSDRKEKLNILKKLFGLVE